MDQISLLKDYESPHPKEIHEERKVEKEPPKTKTMVHKDAHLHYYFQVF
jgi:hypothetical protein